MRRTILLAPACFLAFLAAPAAAAETPKRAEQTALREALERGTLIYAYDQAAWLATDDLLVKLRGQEGKVGGWIVDGPADAPTLIFFDKDKAAPKSVYEAQFRAGQLVTSRVLGEDEDRSLSAERKRLVAAREAASQRMKEAGVQRCSARPFNSVVIPPAAPADPVTVYFLTPQTELKTLPFGGHYRVDVAADGRAGKPRAFTNSCLDMPLPGPADTDVAGLGVSHLLDPIPTEIHVFLSHAAKLPLTVGTSKSKRVWWVDPKGIRLIGRLD